ncbi:cysteine-rich CWC family protein [Bacillus norwichensis]|uniref:Cysteine-rich CWC family protein n=1 Tax=Bacillus norwichensis TaxID=2762217 RepID=A0ABR8VJV5_9BACI|nr:cysteine-rich CWC family protein [Bacillus norwichensis]MBD8005055.1 cysteine-rich CWC family protein [Bacillus norwichensis]
MKSKDEECPICGHLNKCCYSQNKKLGICWCSEEAFPKEIFEQVPQEYLFKTCICKKCLEKFKNSAF